MDESTASRLELVELLTEYTNKLHRYLEYETDRRRRRTSTSRALLIGVLSGLAMGVPLAIYFETSGAFNAAVDASLPLMITLAALLLCSIGAISYLVVNIYGPWRTSSQIPHEALTIAKILERIVARSVQLADHNRSGMDLKFDIKIAEAQAVLSRFNALASPGR